MDALTEPPGGLLLASPNDVTDAAVGTADHTMRHWIAEDMPGPIPLGGEAHLRITNRMFRETGSGKKMVLYGQRCSSTQISGDVETLPRAGAR